MNVVRWSVAGLVVALFAVATSAWQSSPVTDANFHAFLVEFEDGTRRFINGDASLWKANASHGDDVTIMGAWGAYERGWKDAGARYDWAVQRFRDSEASLKVEYISTGASGDLAYTVAIERSSVRVAGQEKPAPMVLRVTHLFRRENGEWRLIHRHADPLMDKTAPATVLQKE